MEIAEEMVQFLEREVEGRKRCAQSDVMVSVEMLEAVLLAGRQWLALKPSGQVAEDEKELTDWLAPTDGSKIGRAPKRIMAALDRIGAKAQGYEALSAVCAAVSTLIGYTGKPPGLPEQVRSVLSLWNKSLLEYKAAARERLEACVERDAAVKTAEDHLRASQCWENAYKQAELGRLAVVADNADLLDLFGEVAKAPRASGDRACAWCGTHGHIPECPVGRALSQPHPGDFLVFEDAFTHPGVAILKRLEAEVAELKVDNAVLTESAARLRRALEPFREQAMHASGSRELWQEEHQILRVCNEHDALVARPRPGAALLEQHRKARDVASRLRARIESPDDPIEARDELVGYLDDLDAALGSTGRSGSGA